MFLSFFLCHFAPCFMSLYWDMILLLSSCFSLYFLLIFLLFASVLWIGAFKTISWASSTSDIRCTYCLLAIHYHFCSARWFRLPTLVLFFLLVTACALNILYFSSIYLHCSTCATLWKLSNNAEKRQGNHEFPSWCCCLLKLFTLFRPPIQFLFLQYIYMDLFVYSYSYGVKQQRWRRRRRGQPARQQQA